MRHRHGGAKGQRHSIVCLTMLSASRCLCLTLLSASLCLCLADTEQSRASPLCCRKDHGKLLGECADKIVTCLLIGSKLATCAQLMHKFGSAHCTHAKHGSEVRASCPKTCNVCPEVAALLQTQVSLCLCALYFCALPHSASTLLCLCPTTLAASLSPPPREHHCCVVVLCDTVTFCGAVWCCIVLYGAVSC